MFSTRDEAKRAGWFSRRHKTSEANDASGETRRQKKARKRAEAEARQTRTHPERTRAYRRRMAKEMKG